MKYVQIKVRTRDGVLHTTSAGDYWQVGQTIEILRDDLRKHPGDLIVDCGVIVWKDASI